MRTRLAMMQCTGPHTTPWMIPQGDESRVRIMHIVQGEEVVVEEDGVEPKVSHTAPGEYHFQPASRFRFVKNRQPDVSGSPTMIEVLYE